MKCKSLQHRRGATLVESAMVLSIVFLFIFGCFDAGLLITRYNFLAEAARRGARTAVVRGEAATELGSLGPATMTFKADAANDIAAACRTVLGTMPLGNVDIEATWPDNSNNLGDPVQVTVRYTHEFTTPILSHIADVELSSTSVMSIAR